MTSPRDNQSLESTIFAYLDLDDDEQKSLINAIRQAKDKNDVISALNDAGINAAEWNGDDQRPDKQNFNGVVDYFIKNYADVLNFGEEVRGEVGVEFKEESSDNTNINNNERFEKFKHKITDIHSLYLKDRQNDRSGEAVDTANKAIEQYHQDTDLEIKVNNLVKDQNSNNKVYKIDGLIDEPVVVQMSLLEVAAGAAYSQLNNLTKPPVWLPKVHTSKMSEETIGDTQMYVSVAVMEFCPTTLESTVNDLKNKNQAERMNTAVKIGQQLSEILSEITNNNLIWIDLKPENILMRKDGSLVISDTKGIFDPWKMEKNTKRNFIKMNNTTDHYISRHLRENINTMKSPAEALFTWDREYSYQLAVNLHYIVTASDKPQPSSFNKDTVFNFDDPVFQSEEGLRMKEIISKLGAANPADRIHHTDASKLLAVISNKVEFDQIMKNADDRVKKEKEGYAKLHEARNEAAAPKEGTRKVVTPDNAMPKKESKIMRSVYNLLVKRDSPSSRADSQTRVSNPTKSTEQRDEKRHSSLKDHLADRYKALTTKAKSALNPKTDHTTTKEPGTAVDTDAKTSPRKKSP